MPLARSRRLSLGIALALSVSGILIACSGAGPSSGTTTGSGSDSHLAVQANGSCTTSVDVLRGTGGLGASCQTYADCAPVCCACSRSSRGFSAAACVNGLCAARETTCSLSTKEDYCPGDPSATDGGPSPDGATIDSAVPPGPTASALCVAFTGSHAIDREAERLATLAQLVLDVTTTSGGGTLNVSRDGAGRPTSVAFQGAGSAQNYNVTITYDAAGNLTSLRRSWSGVTQDDTHTLTYDSSNKLTSFRLSWSGSMPTESETLTYDSSHRLATWRRSWSDSQPTESESLTYDADGYLRTWRRSWSDSQPTETESFSYDSSHRLTSWNRSWSDSTPTQTATISYSGSSRMPASTQTSGPVPGGSQVKDCKK